MHRNVTALYPNRSAAEAIRQELGTLGLPDGDVHVVAGGTDADLAALDLPENDRSHYAARLSAGDVLVSVETPEDRVEVVEAIMRRPSDPLQPGAAGPMGLDASTHAPELPSRHGADAATSADLAEDGDLRRDRPSLLPEAGAFQATDRRL